MSGKAAAGNEGKRRRRRRYPIGQLIAGPKTIDTDRGPVIIDTEHREGQLLVRVEIPSDDSASNVDKPVA